MLSMDAQRFDLRKSARNNLCHFTQSMTHHEEPTSDSHDLLSLLEFFSSRSSNSSITAVKSITSHQVFSNSVTQPSSPSDGLDAQGYDFSKSQPKCQIPSLEIPPTITTCSSPTLELESDSSSNTDVDSDQAREVDSDLLKESEETETNDEYTCTIIRPRPRSPIFNIFSRPSSPVSFTSRPSSPINFGALNCFGNSDNFEEDVEILQAQRAKRMEVRVFVTTTKQVHREESWRVPLTELLYGSNPEEQARVVVSRD